MSNPDDDTGVPSGLNDDAEMERTSPRARENQTGDRILAPLDLFLLGEHLHGRFNRKPTCLTQLPALLEYRPLLTPKCKGEGRRMAR